MPWATVGARARSRCSAATSACMRASTPSTTPSAGRRHGSSTCEASSNEGGVALRDSLEPL
eukprot:1136785-Prymnesium_polylepis.1